MNGIRCSVPMTFYDSVSRERRLKQFAVFCGQNEDAQVVAIHNLGQLGEDISALLADIAQNTSSRKSHDQ